MCAEETSIIADIFTYETSMFIAVSPALFCRLLA